MDKRRIVFSNLVLGMDKIWYMVVRASRDFAAATDVSAFPSMAELQGILGIETLKSPARLSRVLHINGWLDFQTGCSISLRRDSWAAGIGKTDHYTKRKTHPPRQSHTAR